MARRVSCAALALVAVLAFPASVFAQDAAAAEVLFEQGKVLVRQGNYAEACPKFAESHRLAASAGALLNLGECYVKLGKTASAWAAFREAVGSAQAAGQTEREQYARERAGELEPSLAKIVIAVPPAAEVPGLAVSRDGVELGRAVWGTPIPVDPGSHEIRVIAPGKKSWSTRVTIASAAPLTRVTVPSLESGEAPAATREGTTVGGTGPAPAEPWSGQKTAALAAGGAGVVALGVATAFGLETLSLKRAANDHCPTDVTCDAEGFARGQDAHRAATVSTVIFLLGGAAVSAGVVLWLTAPSSPGASVVGLRVGPGSARLEGTW